VEVTLTRSGEDGQQTRLRLVHAGLAGDLGLLTTTAGRASWAAWPP
jgi:hypothetical protein